MFLGKSSEFARTKTESPLEARLALLALYLLLLMPVMMVFARAGVEIISGLIIVLFLARSFYFERWAWLKEPPVIIAGALWLYSVLLVTPFAQDVQLSLERTDWIRFVLLFAAIAYWLSEYPLELKRVAGVSVFLFLLAAVDALWQFKTGISLSGSPYVDERLTGPFSKTVVGIYLTKMCIPMIGLLLYYAWADKKSWQLALLLVLLAVFFTTVLVSNELTAIFTFLLALLIIGGGMFFRYRRLWLPLLGVALVICSIIVAAYYSQAILQRRIHFTEQTFGSFGHNPYGNLWRAAVVMWQKHPVTGVGSANFREVCPLFPKEYYVKECSQHPHNLYLEILSELGVMGMVGFALLIGSLFVSVFKASLPPGMEGTMLRLFALAGLVINFFPLLPTQSFFSNWPAFLAWQSIAWSVAMVHGKRKNNA